ncbi:RagB/SusD family nutrient uptake outer membrane protein [Autumnicola musiva]|uniref:RagB/SusD family nutrient uptake outer membrane protein n=1 Tax=Autumnicola musiva TaxID=3075589 RepID=A0ABU3DBI7_9FLAO|nr:RagB/SusD family nutrient uptake outer membrane protein [Zunongwangia sp. F117]MDT0678333.1 RagB/SusD family nutrient uptake outer membrane protein [Zunongwangia sp. F117]
MKNYIVKWIKRFDLLILVMFIGVIQACTDFTPLGDNFLEKPPSQDVTIDTIFSRADLAQRFLTNNYRTLPYGPGIVDAPYDRDKLGRAMLASLTDINQSYLTTSGANRHYYSGSYTAYTAQNNSGAVKYNYSNSGAWQGIRGSYIFIDNVDRVPDMTTETKKRLIAEARMIIAVHYVDMFRNYGGMPWVDHAYGPNEDFELPRLTAEATLDSTTAMIDRAIPDLPFSLNNPGTEAGRFTQAAAMGLKVRLLLFAASPLFNASQPYMEGEATDQKLVWFGSYDPSLWQRAANAAKDLINKAEGSGYHLLDTGNPRQDFQDAYNDRDSPEVLISTRVQYQAGGDYYFFDLEERNVGPVTHNYVNMFPMDNGKQITDPASGYDPQNPYQNRDPRLYETVLINEDIYQNRTAETWIGGRERLAQGALEIATGYRIRKFVLDGIESRGATAHWPLLRLPEIYLSYAETLNEINGGPTPEAYEYVNKVRRRVDLGDLPTGLSQVEFREAVLRERVLELGFEEVRWYDMIRWKREEVFKKTLYGMDITKNDNGNFNYDQFELPSRFWQNNWSPKWYLSAFPINEILKEYGLIQNPGWEL